MCENIFKDITRTFALNSIRHNRMRSIKITSLIVNLNKFSFLTFNERTC